MDTTEALSWRKIFLFFTVCHLLTAIFSCHLSWEGFVEGIINLDSHWYTHLALNGYSPAPWFSEQQHAQYAFFPLWPMLLYIFSPLHSEHLIALCGSVTSIFFFVLSVQKIITNKNHWIKLGLISENSRYYWIALLLTPGSWVLFTNHTEGFFLYLSISSFILTFEKKWLPASAVAGLCALTRNQGVLVALCVGITLASQEKDKKIIRFIKSGVVSGCFYSMWLTYLYYRTGSIWSGFSAQHSWSFISSFGQYFQNMMWLSPNKAFRALCFWGIMLFGIKLLFQSNNKRQSYPLAIYLLLSVLIWPLQGQGFPQAYRFGVVLFPFWLSLGAFFEKLHARINIRYKHLFYSFLITLLFLSLWMNGVYFTNHAWPY